MLDFLYKKLVFTLTVSGALFFLIFISKAQVTTKAVPDEQTEATTEQSLAPEEEIVSLNDHLVIGHPQNMARVITVELIKRGFRPTVLVPRGWRAEARKVLFPTESFDLFEGNVESDDKSDLKKIIPDLFNNKEKYAALKQNLANMKKNEFEQNIKNLVAIMFNQHVSSSLQTTQESSLSPDQ